jgi:hypothetical protein
MRVFFGHPKAWDDELINEAVSEIASSMTADLGEPVEVIPGRDDFQKNIANEGNFNGWCRSITRRGDYATGQKFYNIIIVPKSDGIGKATAQIAEDAIRAGMPVLEVEFTDDGGIVARAVARVEAEDTENFIAGWRLITIDT